MTRQQVEEEIALNDARERDAWTMLEEAREHYQELCAKGARLRRIRDGREPVRLDPDPVEHAAEHGATPTVELDGEDTVR